MAALSEKIRGLSPHKVVRLVQNSIFETKCRPLEEYASYSQRLTRGERYMILSYAFVVEVANGGLNQYLCNSSGDYTEDTLVMLGAIGATEAARALSEIKQVIYRSAPIPQDRKQRCEILFAWEEEDENRSRQLFDRINRKLGWCEAVDEAAAHFILGHIDEFDQTA